MLIDALHSAVYLPPLRWTHRLPDHDQSSPVLRRRGPSTDLLFKSLEQLTSFYTVNDLKTPTSQKTVSLRVEKRSRALASCMDYTARFSRSVPELPPGYTAPLQVTQLASRPYGPVGQGYGLRAEGYAYRLEGTYGALSVTGCCQAPRPRGAMEVYGPTQSGPQGLRGRGYEGIQARRPPRRLSFLYCYYYLLFYMTH